MTGAVTELAATVAGDSGAGVVTALTRLGADNAATITGEISATNANTIAAATTGVVTATITTGGVTATLGALTSVDANDSITFTTNDTSVDASDFNDLVVKVDNFTHTSVTGAVTELAATITGDSGAGVATALTTLGGDNAATITGEISAANANTIANATSGIVTATLSSDNLANFSSLAETGNAYTITVNNSAEDTLQASELATLGGKSIATVTVQYAVTISGTSSEIMAALSTTDTKVIASSANIIITDALTIAQYRAIDLATNGTLTYSSVADTIGNLLTDAGSGGTAVAYNKSITVTSTGTLQAADLVTLSGNTNQTVTASAATTISGSATQLLAIVNDTGINTSTNYNAVITGTALISEINNIDADTTGSISVGDIVDSLGNIFTFNSLSITNQVILQNASSITANGNNNPDSQNFESVLHGMFINSYGGIDSITGTGFNDFISGGPNADSLSGGGGSDTFIYTTGDAFVDRNVSTFEVISDFEKTVDKIDFTFNPIIRAAGSATANFGGETGGVSIDANGKITFQVSAGAGEVLWSEYLGAVRSIVTQQGQVGFFDWFDEANNSNGTLLYQEYGVTGDMIILLAGVTGIADISTTFGDANTMWVI